PTPSSVQSSVPSAATSSYDFVSPAAPPGPANFYHSMPDNPPVVGLPASDRSAAPPPTTDATPCPPELQAFDARRQTEQAVPDTFQYEQFMKDIRQIVKCVISISQPTILDHNEQESIRSLFHAPLSANTQALTSILLAQNNDLENLLHHLVRLTGAMRCFARLQLMYTTGQNLGLTEQGVEDALLFANVI
ncbi:hypothetical protein JX265_014118, partial [Neoarthrinium moseri]